MKIIFLNICLHLWVNLIGIRLAPLILFNKNKDKNNYDGIKPKEVQQSNKQPN